MEHVVRALRVIAYAQVGHDPATERQRIRSAPRFDDFLAEYWTRWSPQWKASTLETHDGYRRKYLDNAFQGLFIDELNEEHLTKWFADLNNRTSPGAANRTLEILKHMFNKAETWSYRLENTNPCRAVRANLRKHCERFLTKEELASLGDILDAMRTGTDSARRGAAAVISLLLLTGCRYREIMDLQWSDVKGNRLKLRDSKTGPRTVWLNALALWGLSQELRDSAEGCSFWSADNERQLAMVFLDSEEGDFWVVVVMRDLFDRFMPVGVNGPFLPRVLQNIRFRQILENRQNSWSPRSELPRGNLRERIC
jgi:integrase